MVDMDPRIQERRIEILRAKGKRRLRVVLLIVSLVLLIIGGVVVTKSSLLDVDSIIVKGADSELANLIEEQSGIRKSTPLLEVNSRSAISRIKQIPQIKSARISKSFGGDVTINVTLRSPVAAASDKDSWVLLDSDGRVVDRILELPFGYPVVEGLEKPLEIGKSVSEQGLSAIDLAKNLPPILAADISSIQVGETLELNLYGEGKVLFGDTSNRTEKILAVATILEQADLNDLVHVDVRAPRNPVVCRSQECSYDS